MGETQQLEPGIPLPVVSAVRSLKVSPGDTIVLECARQVTGAENTKLYRHLESMFPEQKIMILCDGLTISKVVKS